MHMKAIRMNSALWSCDVGVSCFASFSSEEGFVQEVRILQSSELYKDSSEELKCVRPMTSEHSKVPFPWQIL